MAEPFSFEELTAAGAPDVAPVEKLAADDGVALAVRCYVPPRPRAVVVFLHGGGAHSGAGYAHLARGLAADFDVATFTPDLRGHGESDGPRGDAPSPARLWQDVALFVELARARHPGIPLYLGGHSSGGGLALNCASWARRERAALADGYLFLAPQLGYKSDTERAKDPSDTRPAFAEVSLAPFIANGMSGGWLFAHSRAVRFRYPPERVAADPGMVAFNTVSFANGLTPKAPKKQFAALDRPFGLWIGERDEIFDPQRVLAYGPLAREVAAESCWAEIPERNHLGVLVDAHRHLGAFLRVRTA